MSAATLKAPSLKAVQAAVAEAEAAARAKQARIDELARALAALGLERRADSRLCDAFEAGAPVPGFATAERVAREMALMHWLHKYTDFEARVEREVEALRREAGHYFAGINREAHESAKAGFRRPERWPWL